MILIIINYGPPVLYDIKKNAEVLQFIWAFFYSISLMNYKHYQHSSGIDEISKTCKENQKEGKKKNQVKSI